MQPEHRRLLHDWRFDILSHSRNTLAPNAYPNCDIKSYAFAHPDANRDINADGGANTGTDVHPTSNRDARRTDNGG